MKTITRNNSPLTDETLIRLVLDGQENAYTILVKRHESLLHHVLQSYLPDYGARQEVIQDTFLRAFCALSSFRGESKFSTWLARIAKSTALSRLQLRRYAAWDSIETAMQAWESDLYTNEVMMEKQESNEMLQMAVRKLNPSDAIALDMFYFREQSLEEIGQITGWSIPNVKSRLFRARQRLHATLVEEGLHAEFFA